MTVQAPKRLVVELNRRADADLAWLTETEELNKTTVVNRAIQVYRMIVDAQLAGGDVVIENPTDRTAKHIRFV